MEHVLGSDRVPPQREAELRDLVALVAQRLRGRLVDARRVRVLVRIQEVHHQCVIDNGRVQVRQRAPVVQCGPRALVRPRPEARLAPEGAARVRLGDELRGEDVQGGEAGLPPAVGAQAEEDHLGVGQIKFVAQVRHHFLGAARARLALAQHVPAPQPRLLKVQRAVGVLALPLAGREGVCLLCGAHREPLRLA